MCSALLRVARRAKRQSKGVVEERPTFEDAVKEILQSGGLGNCPMCLKNDNRIWQHDVNDSVSEPLRLVCSNCHYIVQFDWSSIYRAIKKRAASAQ
jgi:hypothetical protein